MKKYMLLFSVCFVGATSSYAIDAKTQLKALQDIYQEEFAQIDADKNGLISSEEYLDYQFKHFRNTLTTMDKLEMSESAEEETEVRDTKIDENQPQEDIKETETAPRGLQALSDVSATLQEMADFDVDLDLDAPETEEKPENRLSKEDVLPSNDDLPAMPDLTILEETKNTEDTNRPQEDTVSKPSVDKTITGMLEMIKKTLPKKIDDITTWTDIEYENNSISYIYQADVDTSKFSDTQRETLTENIKKEACTSAYTQMCPKMKPMFIDKGIEMKIRYLDKNNIELSSCEFNNETCKM